MIRVMVSYPKADGAKFDFEYYLSTQLPMLETKLRGRGLTAWMIDQGISGRRAGNRAGVPCAGLPFESVEAFKAAMEGEGAEIMADIPNYTDLTSDPSEQSAGAAGIIIRISDFGGWREQALKNDA